MREEWVDGQKMRDIARRTSQLQKRREELSAKAALINKVKKKRRRLVCRPATTTTTATIPGSSPLTHSPHLTHYRPKLPAVRVAQVEAQVPAAAP